MGDRSLEARVDELESRAAIADLIAGYCEGVDHRDMDRFMGLWHEDSQLSIDGGRGDFQGTDRLRESQAGVAKAWARTWHWTSNHTATFQDADHATGRSDVFAVCEHHNDGGTCLVGGTYFDSYERRNGEWKFAKRAINRWFVTPAQDIPLPPPS